MAKIVYFQDDFDGVTIDDTVRTRTVRLEEGTLTIDMSDDNYGKLMAAVTPFIDKGEWTPRETGNDENTLIREWARANGHDVSARGRLSADVVRAYREAHKSPDNATGQDNATDNGSDTDNAPDNDASNDNADNGNVSAPVPVNA